MRLKFPRLPALISSLILCSHAMTARGEGLLAINNPAANGPERLYYLVAQAFQGNDAVSLREYLGEWQGRYTPRDGENLGLATARVETGVQWQGWRFGVLYRAEALARTNRDSTDLVRQYFHGNSFDQGRSYVINYQLRGFEANGLRLSKSASVPLSASWHASFGAGAAILQGKRLRLMSATGQAQVLSAQNISVRATLDTHDNRMDTSGQGDFNPPYGAQPGISGQGFAADAGVVLQHEHGTRLEAAINDLYGYLDWQNLPRIVTTYNTASTYYDTQGYVHFNPLGTSQSSYRNLAQTLEPKIWLAASHPLGPIEVQLASSFVSGLNLPEIGAYYRPRADILLRASYELRFGSYGLEVQRDRYFLALRTQDINFDSARAYGISAGLAARF